MNFEEISKKVKKFSKDTMTEVQKMNEVRQLNSRISDEKKKITRTYTEIGKKIYELYKEAPLEGFEADIQAIEESIRMMDLLQDQIRNVKGVVLCPCCNMEVNASERFCSNCGNKMPEVIEVADDAEEINSVIETEDVIAVEDLAAEAEAMEAEFNAELEAEETAEAAAEATEETVEAAEEAAETVEEVVEELAEAVEEVVEETEEETAEAVEE